MTCHVVAWLNLHKQTAWVNSELPVSEDFQALARDTCWSDIKHCPTPMHLWLILLSLFQTLHSQSLPAGSPSSAAASTRLRPCCDGS